MKTKLAFTALFAAQFCVGAYAQAQDANSVIANAKKALGDPTSITYSGSARDVSFQQCGANATALVCYGTHDPQRPITDYVRVIDLAAPTSRHTGSTQNIGPGGSTAITSGTFFQQVTPEQAALSAPWAQSLELYITPWGFLKGAEASSATARTETIDGKSYTVLSFSPEVKAPSGKEYTINGYVNADNLVERVETWLGENIMGDMHIVAEYSGYRDFNGVTVPTKIVQTRGGYPFFAVDVSAAAGNPTDLASLAPAPQRPAGGPPPGGPPALTVASEQLSDTLYRLTTGQGSYDTLVADFGDHLFVFEGGQSEARSLAYIPEIKKLFPGKPIRYVWNSHPHSDHTGGLPAYVAEGATIVTHANNQAFFEKALNTPRTLLDDTLAKNPKPATVEAVGDKKVYSNGTNTVEIYHIFPAPHSNGLTVAYFPNEKVLFQGDFSLPAPGQPGNDHVKALVPALEKLGLVNFERYINVHASAEPQTKAQLWAAVGRSE